MQQQYSALMRAAIDGVRRRISVVDDCLVGVLNVAAMVSSLTGPHDDYADPVPEEEAEHVGTGSHERPWFCFPITATTANTSSAAALVVTSPSRSSHSGGSPSRRRSSSGRGRGGSLGASTTGAFPYNP